MRKQKWTARSPNKLQGSAVLKLSDDPLIGVFLLKTDRFATDIAINRAAAEELYNALAIFLASEKAHPE